jgi:hypothetical protein
LAADKAAGSGDEHASHEPRPCIAILGNSSVSRAESLSL